MEQFDKQRSPETYENFCQLPDFSMGKVIVTREGDKIRLFGNLLQNPGIRALSASEAEEHFLRTSKIDPARLARIYGFHEEISHTGKIIGGAFIMVHQGKVFITGESRSFGQADREDIQHCLADRQVEFDE
jgi:hypothetical protein